MSVPRLWTRFQSQILRRMPDARLQRLLAIPLVGRVVAWRIRKAMGLDSARLFGSHRADFAGHAAGSRASASRSAKAGA